jgi:hypothetical protein
LPGGSFRFYGHYFGLPGGEAGQHGAEDDRGGDRSRENEAADPVGEKLYRRQAQRYNLRSKPK